MFSQVCVIHSVHGGTVSQHAVGQGCLYPSMQLGGGGVYPSMQLGRGCIPACNWAGDVSQHAIGQGVYPSMQLGRGCASQHAIGQGVCIPVCSWAGGVHPSMQLGRGGCQPPWTHTAPREIAIKAGGTHPIGMHSCYCLWLLFQNADALPLNTSPLCSLTDIISVARRML